MNLIHRWICSSRGWATRVETELLPWALDGVKLGDNVLEVGPGYGANLRVLCMRTPALTALELSEELTDHLVDRYGSAATVINGDGTAMPFPDNDFSAVVCFTMLHHVPTAPLQDALVAEAYRVLRPGGVFAGSDGVHGTIFRLLHIGDTYNPMPTNTFEDRLAAAGFVDIEHQIKGRTQRFHARKP